jgi:4-amino-4-deoxy-L-arabinose transferase-like glycosyltransferase
VSRLAARPLLLLVLVTLGVSLLGITNHELWTPDEPRVAGIGREMWESAAREGIGAWAVPRLSGEPFLEKPPLYWWAEGAVFSLAGRTSAGLARLPSALFGIAAVLATWALARRFFGPGAALFAGLVLLTSYRFLWQTHWIVVDPALVAATTAALAAFVHAEQRRGAGRTLRLAAGYAALAAAFLTKGVIGLGIPVLGYGVYLLWTGRLRDFLGPHLAWGALLVVGLVAAWLALLAQREGPEALRTFLVYHQLGRFVPGVVDYSGGHERPLWYYLTKLPGDLLPWTPLALLAALAGRRALPALPAREADGLRFAAASTLPALAVLSLAGTKRGLYLLPLFPSLALAVGWWMARAGDADLPPWPRWEKTLARVWRPVLVGAAGILCLGAAVLDPAWWPASLACALLFAGAAWLVLVRRPASDPAARWLAATLLVALGWACALATAFPANDPGKSLRPLLEEVAAQVPPTTTLHLFRPTETTRGYVAFYAPRPVAIVPDLEALADLVPERPFVLFEGKRKRGDYPRVVEAGIPHRVLARAETRSGRVLVLARLGSAEADLRAR